MPALTSPSLYRIRTVDHFTMIYVTVLSPRVPSHQSTGSICAITMHQALTVREVLANVFRSLEQRDLFSCALVCEDWTDIAVDFLWREVDLFALPLPFSTGYSSSQPPEVIIF